MLEIRNNPVLPWQERQADMLFVLILAADFQGFARGLHDEAAGVLAATLTHGDQRLAKVLSDGVKNGRALDRNNAGSQTMANDFGRLGLNFWRAVTAQFPAAGPGWRSDLDDMVKIRNAIAHDNQSQIQDLAKQGLVLDRRLTGRWHNSPDSLSDAVDHVVGDYLRAMLGVPGPW